MSEWVFGRRTAAEHLAVSPDTCLRLLVTKGSRPPHDLLRLARSAGVPAEEAPRERLDTLSRQGNHQGVCLEVGGWSYRELPELVERAKGSGRFPLLMALDCVQDPRNLGAVLRVADGVGAAGVIVPKDRAAGLSAAVARTASGALASVPVARVVNLARTLDQLREEGFWTLGTSGPAAEVADLFEATVRFPAVLVLGGEHKGLRPNVSNRCDLRVAVPMGGAVSSLNVAVAGGVCAYELLRRWKAAPTPLSA